MKRHLERMTLRSSLLLDAAVCAIAGPLMLATARQLGDLFDLPVAMFRVIGGILVPYIALLLIIAPRSSIAPTAAWIVIGTNLLWSASSFVVLLCGLIDPSTLGIALVISQAIMVAPFAELHFITLNQRHAAP